MKIENKNYTLGVYVAIIGLLTYVMQIAIVLILVFCGILIRNTETNKTYVKLNGLYPDSHITIDVSSGETKPLEEK